MAPFLFEVEWDPAKARTNFGKHGLDFERAAEVFRDPLALTTPDDGLPACASFQPCGRPGPKLMTMRNNHEG
jgi:hypothetical protein